MKYLIPLLLPVFLFGQTEQKIFDGFNQTTYKVRDWRVFGNPAPWQTWRHSFRHAIQIDVHVNKKEMDALMADRHIIYRDLHMFYNGMSLDALNVVQRDYFCKVRTAANPQPLNQFWKLELFQSRWLDETEDNPYYGWHWGTIADDKICFAVKQLEADRWHLSFAILMEFVGPWLDRPGVSEGEIMPLPAVKERKKKFKD